MFKLAWQFRLCLQSSAEHQSDEGLGGVVDSPGPNGSVQVEQLLKGHADKMARDTVETFRKLKHLSNVSWFAWKKMNSLAMYHKDKTNIFFEFVELLIPQKFSLQTGDFHQLTNWWMNSCVFAFQHSPVCCSSLQHAHNAMRQRQQRWLTLTNDNPTDWCYWTC